MRRLNAYKIIELLETPTEDRRPTVRHIQARAAKDEIMAALKLATTPLTRYILCWILGARHIAEAAPALVEALDDADPNVRGAAADALAKIADSDSGPALLEHLQVEQVVGVRQMLVLALGASRYGPAIPELIRILGDPDATTRGCAAWSLGALCASEAGEALERALRFETDDYARIRMEVALKEVQGNGPAAE